MKNFWRATQFGEERFLQPSPQDFGKKFFFSRCFKDPFHKKSLPKIGHFWPFLKNVKSVKMLQKMVIFVRENASKKYVVLGLIFENFRRKNAKISRGKPVIFLL